MSVAEKSDYTTPRRRPVTQPRPFFSYGPRRECSRLLGPGFLAYRNALVGRHVREHLGTARGPANLKPVHCLRVAETKVQHR